MRIRYATPAASPSWTTLGDESDRSALFELFAPSFQPLNQIEPLAGGSNSFKAVRGNVAVSVQIVVSIPYATRALALEAIYTIRNAFTVKKHLEVYQVDTANKTIYFPNAVLTNYAPVPRGVTVQHSFAFQTDDITTSAPTT